MYVINIVGIVPNWLRYTVINITFSVLETLYNVTLSHYRNTMFFCLVCIKIFLYRYHIFMQPNRHTAVYGWLHQYIRCIPPLWNAQTCVLKGIMRCVYIFSDILLIKCIYIPFWIVRRCSSNLLNLHCLGWLFDFIDPYIIDPGLTQDWFASKQVANQGWNCRQFSARMNFGHCKRLRWPVVMMLGYVNDHYPVVSATRGNHLPNIAIIIIIKPFINTHCSTKDIS